MLLGKLDEIDALADRNELEVWLALSLLESELESLEELLESAAERLDVASIVSVLDSDAGAEDELETNEVVGYAELCAALLLGSDE